MCSFNSHVPGSDDGDTCEGLLQNMLEKISSGVPYLNEVQSRHTCSSSTCSVDQASSVGAAMQDARSAFQVGHATRDDHEEAFHIDLP